MSFTYEQNLQNEWEKYRNENKQKIFPTVLIAGCTGVGKSSLINLIFGDRSAKTSDVKPETQGFHIYYGKNYNRKINLIDSAGYETNQANTYYNDLAEVIRHGLDDNPVHVIWYCISIANKRIEPFDIEILNKTLAEPSIRKRLCVVFTKCDYDDDNSTIANTFRSTIKEALHERGIPIRGLVFFETCNDINLPLQVNDLISWSANTIDDTDLRRFFVAAQKNNLDIKKQEADNIIQIATAAAAGIGAIPIPFSDAPLLTAAQVKMVSSILDVYELSAFTTISSKMIGNIVISQIGKSIVGSIMKMFPGIGSVLGAMVNGAVASTLTFALGSAISEICYKFNDNALKGTILDVKNLFDDKSIRLLMDKYKK